MAASEDGASYSEQLMEASRRDNISLFEDLEKESKNIAELINTATDPVGNYALHIAASNGSHDILDRILDIEDVEVDPINRQFGDTPLHSAVKYSINEPELGAYLVEMLIEAGADPTLRNKDGQTPLDLAPPTNDKLIEILQGAEMARQVAPEELAPTEELDGEDEGSASDSD